MSVLLLIGEDRPIQNTKDHEFFLMKMIAKAKKRSHIQLGKNLFLHETFKHPPEDNEGIPSKIIVFSWYLFGVALTIKKSGPISKCGIAVESKVKIINDRAVFGEVREF
jgi:hypothetical protein